MKNEKPAYRHIGVDDDVFNAVEKWKDEVAKSLGLSKLSFNQFLLHLSKNRTKNKTKKCHD